MADVDNLPIGTLVRITDQRRAESQYMERFVALHGALMVVQRVVSEDPRYHTYTLYHCKSLATGEEAELFRRSVEVNDG